MRGKKKGGTTGPVSNLIYELRGRIGDEFKLKQKSRFFSFFLCFDEQTAHNSFDTKLTRAANPFRLKSRREE